MTELYNHLIAAKRDCGERIGPLTLEVFTEFLESRADQIKANLSSSAIDFVVGVDNGRVKFAARAVQEKPASESLSAIQEVEFTGFVNQISHRSAKQKALLEKQGRLSLCAWVNFLQSLHGFGLRSFRALDYFEFDGLALLERFVAVLFYGRVVDKDIGPTRLLDKSIALGIAEPLDLAL